MAISDTWTLPAEAGNLDLDAGATLGETQWDQLVSDVLYLYNRSAPYGQLPFPATRNASAGANTLDEYEESTWTPSVGGTATYTTQVGTYTKIGDMVFVTMYLTINVLGTGSVNTISGLPFAGIRNFAPLACEYWLSAGSSFYFVAGHIQTGGSTINVMGTTAAGANINTTPTFFANSAQIILGGCYHG